MGYERVYLSHFLEIVHAPPLPPKHGFEMVETLQHDLYSSEWKRCCYKQAAEGLLASFVSIKCALCKLRTELSERAVL
jgi:hypothetical protein